MTALAAAPPRLDMGRVVNRMFGAIGANFGPFILLAILLAALPAFLLNLGQGYIVQALVANYYDVGSLPLIAALLTLIMQLLLMVPSYILVGALTQGSIVFYNGGKASFGECLSTGLRFVLPLVGLGIITVLGLLLWSLPVVVGLFLVGGAFVAVGGPGVAGPFLALLVSIVFLIPAMMAAVRWMVSAPALVVERLGVFSALRRSGELTRFTRWRVFWLVVIYLVVMLLIQGAFTFMVSGVLISARGDLGLWPLIIQGVTIVYSAINSMIGAAGAAAMYFDLRVAREGATSDELAKVFE